MLEAAGKRTQTAPLRQRVEHAEVAIKRLNSDIENLDKALAEVGLFSRDPGRGAQLAKKRSETAAALARAEEEWLAASSEFEAATA
jgi:ATP-binding cassette subfamily F protein 3